MFQISEDFLFDFCVAELFSRLKTIILSCSSHKLCTILIIIGSSPDSSENPFPDMEDMEKDCNE
jgi:hypothetical protein